MGSPLVEPHISQLPAFLSARLMSSSSPVKAETALASDTFQQRVIKAAEAVLKADGAVGPLELFHAMGMLHDRHIKGWRQGSPHYPNLESWIQIGPAKFKKATHYFSQWAAERGLRPLE